jgi:hypothetical protein
MRNLNLGGLFVETDTPEFLAFLAFLVLAKGMCAKLNRRSFSQAPVCDIQE